MKRTNNKPSRAMRKAATQKARRKAFEGPTLTFEGALQKLRAEGSIQRSVVKIMRRMDRAAARLGGALSVATWEAIGRDLARRKHAEGRAS